MAKFMSPHHNLPIKIYILHGKIQIMYMLFLISRLCIRHDDVHLTTLPFPLRQTNVTHYTAITNLLPARGNV